MSPEATGLIGILLLLVLFILRMPVAFAMALVGVSGFAYLNGMESALTILAQDVYETLSSYPLSVIPMFILMGSMAFASGISQRLYKTCYTWLGQFRGGLTVATVVACSGFAAICGSTAATAATMGGIALPEMKKYGYNDQLATGTVASAGTLGILIPPSTVLIVYGILTEESIGKLFISGILPGIIMTLFFVITVVILCLRRPDLAPAGPRTSLKAKVMSLGGIVEAVLLFLLTIIQLSCFFSIPYFVYRSFGLNTASWLDMTLVGAFLQVMVSYFPTPGASGASEGAFYVFYPIFFPKPFIFIAMLMWRILSYYLNIGVGVLLVFLDGILHISRQRVPLTGDKPVKNA